MKSANSWWMPPCRSIGRIVEGNVLLELKPVEQIAQVHSKQVLTYLKLKGLHLGFLLNFGASLMKDGIERVVNGLPEP